MWFLNAVNSSNNIIKVDVRDLNGSMTKVVIPSDYYPLNGRAEVLNCINCSDEITDDMFELISIFNTVPYKLGHCYQNSKELDSVLKFFDYKSTAYAGWLFIDCQLPVHHSWVILRKGSHRYLLDLVDEYETMLANEDSISTEKDLMNYFRWSLKLDNSVRCRPVGVPSSKLLYVGCPCEPDEARAIWKRLVERYPDHTSWKKNKQGEDPSLSDMQVKMRRKGIIDDKGSAI